MWPYFLRSVVPAVVCGSSKWAAHLLSGGVVAGGMATLYVLQKEKIISGEDLVKSFATVHAATKVTSEQSSSVAAGSSNNEEKSKKEVPQNKKAVRGKRMRKKFLSYASVVHKDHAYMTPEDFLLALVERPSRLAKQGGKAKELSEDEVKAMLKSVPDIKKASSQLFRSLGDKGLISFPEFVCLLCALTRSERGFKMGFLMLDDNANGNIDLHEFTQLTEQIGHVYAGDICEEEEEHGPINKSAAPSLPSTSLTVHLFGAKGRGTLAYDQFHKFVTNLWNEVIEVEYERAADPQSKDISVTDFGRIVLRYTLLDDVEQKNYLAQLRKKSIRRVSFEEFHQFNQFIAHLDDFRLAMRMYSLAGVSVNQEELARAIYVSSGIKFTPSLLEVIYAVFDTDEDAKLSYREFVSVLHDRLHRTLRSVASSESQEDVSFWVQWKNCMRQEVRRTV